MPDIRHIDMHYAPVMFASRKDWERYAAWLKRQAKVSFALAPEAPRTPLNAKIFGKWTGSGYTCEKVYFESLSGFYVTGNLFRPLEKPKSNIPGILCPHGHWPDGRLHDHDPAGSVIARCIQLARMGATVFNYDMTGYNDSCQLVHRATKDDHQWCLSLMSIQTLNSVRSLDFISSLPEVDDKRLGVTGASGGGTQTFSLFAVDDRVSVSAPICMISYTMQGGCKCENTPLLRIGATSVDLARLFAPKPMFMGSCTGDWTKNTEKEELPAVKHVYDLYGASKQLMHCHVDYDHNYNKEMREHVYGFFNKFIFDAKSAAPVSEQNVVRPPMRDRMVWWGRKAPDEISNSEFQRMWIDRRMKALKPHLKNAETVRKGLGGLLPHALGVTLDSVAEFQKRKPGSVKIEISGHVMNVSAAKPLNEPEHKYQFYNAYNRMPFADRVHEILAAVEKAGGNVELRGVKDAGPACLVAAALSEKVTKVDADMLKFDLENNLHYERCFNTPAFRQVGGLATVFALIGKRPMTLKNVSENAEKLRRKYGHV